SRLVWDQEVASSNLAIPTISQCKLSNFGELFLFKIFEEKIQEEAPMLISGPPRQNSNSISPKLESFFVL
ncbi:MAG TPA: hypothetical protein PKU77_13705, partial [Ferruginibacter sp.]|nr:hypothetical protein [Ferruginibacter sp.]